MDRAPTIVEGLLSHSGWTAVGFGAISLLSVLGAILDSGSRWIEDVLAFVSLIFLFAAAKLLLLLIRRLHINRGAIVGDGAHVLAIAALMAIAALPVFGMQMQN